MPSPVIGNEYKEELEMLNKFYTTLTIAVALAGSISLAPRVSADEIMQVTRTTTTTTESSTPSSRQTTVIERNAVIEGTPVAPGMVVPVNRVVSVETQVVPLAVSDAQLILQTVDDHRSILDKAIVDSRSAGTLSEQQAASYRRELDRIGAEISYLKGLPNPSVSRSIVVGQDLDILASRMRSVITTITYVPIIEGTHFTIINGRRIQLDEPAVRRVNLEIKILDWQAAGKITEQQCNILRADLNEIAGREDAYRMKGALTDKEARDIYLSMDKVASQLERFAK